MTVVLPGIKIGVGNYAVLCSDSELDEGDVPSFVSDLDAPLPDKLNPLNIDQVVDAIVARLADGRKVGKEVFNMARDWLIEKRQSFAEMGLDPESNFRDSYGIEWDKLESYEGHYTL